MDEYQLHMAAMAGLLTFGFTAYKSMQFRFGRKQKYLSRFVAMESEIVKMDVLYDDAQPGSLIHANSKRHFMLPEYVKMNKWFEKPGVPVAEEEKKTIAASNKIFDSLCGLLEKHGLH